MWFVWTVGCLAVIYLAVGVLVGYVNATSKDDEFKFNWKQVLTWPRNVFGVGR